MIRDKLVRNSNLLFYFLIIYAFFSYILFAVYLTFDVPYGDHWRWIRQGLIPLDTGTVSVFDFITREYYPFSHSHILTLTLVWLNKNYFGLNYVIESGLGTFSLLITTIILSYYWYRLYYKNKNNSNIKDGFLPLMTINILVLLDLKNFNSWTLVQFEFIYFLFAIIYLIIADNVLKEKISLNPFLVLTFIMMFLGDAIGVTAILAFLCYLVLFELKSKKSLIFKIALTLLFAIISAHILIKDMHPHTKISKFEALSYLLNHLPDTVSMLVKAFTQSVLQTQELKVVFADNWEIYQYLIGVIVGCFILFSIWLYIQNRKNMNSSLPVTLILVTCVTIIGIYLTRFPVYGDNVIQDGRYVRSLQLWLLGSFPIIFLVQSENFPLNKYFNSLKLFRLLTFSIVVIVFTVNQYGNWKYYRNREAIFMNFAQAIKEYDTNADAQRHLINQHNRCKNEFCKPSIQYLKKNKLSIFRES